MLRRPDSLPSELRRKRSGSEAERQRRARARRRRGVMTFRVEANEHRLAEALIESGRLTEALALERPQIERELAKLIDDWIRRWLENRHA
jgi:hypothetical protein